MKTTAQHIQRKPFPNVLVRRSAMSGLGLFTLDPIQKGTRVIEYTGEIISSDEADRRGGKYLFDISSRNVVDGKARDNVARYINHSCRSNCEPRVWRRHIFIYAKKNIEAGEELTYHYGKEYFTDYIKSKGCRCLHCKNKT